MALDPYEYRGAEALVALHAEHLREFLVTWRRADAQSLKLPTSSNPNYSSREALLAHVMGCAARYLIWICEQAKLPAPTIEERPEPSGFAARAEDYMEGILAAWKLPLRTLTEDLADSRAFMARWGAPYTIDAMLEHAVIHPMRHSYQLEKLMAAPASS